MRVVDPFPWLVSPPAVDLANTVVPGGLDLLADDAGLAEFLAVEADRMPGMPGMPGIADLGGRLADLRAARDVVRPVLAAAAAGADLPPDEVRRLNAWSAAGPTYPVLVEGAVRTHDAARTPLQSFRAAVARSTMDVVAGGEVRVCHAPACGMFYVRAHPRQQWCSAVCGNRARVARHAASARARAGTGRSRPA